MTRDYDLATGKNKLKYKENIIFYQSKAEIFLKKFYV